MAAILPAAPSQIVQRPKAAFRPQGRHRSIVAGASADRPLVPGCEKVLFLSPGSSVLENQGKTLI